jgi:capsular exopolysaccharide synthesis family protein
MTKTYREKHPRLTAIDSRLESLDASLKEEAARVAEGMKLAYEEAAGRERKAVEALEAAKGEKVRFDRDVMDLTKLQREAEAETSLFQNILKRIQETSVSSGIEMTNISVVDKPVVPTAPSAPNRKMHLALGLAAGLALGLGVAFLVEQVDPTIDAPDEAERVIGGPLLGVIPHFGEAGNGYGPKYYESTGERPATGDGPGGSAAATPAEAPEARRREPPPTPTRAGDGASRSLMGSRILRAIGMEIGGGAASHTDELVCHTDLKSRASEAFRSVRTAIQFAGRADGRTGGSEVMSLAVVSVAPQEGKTLAALNLAVAMAQVGHRVLVVDADMRRPRVHKALGMEAAGAGLSEVLQGTATLDDVARETKVEGLWVVTAGAVPPNPSELLSSPRLAMFVHEAEGRFDRVLFDSPPVGAVTDACVLAPALDAVVQVIGYGRASRQEVREGKRQLEALGARYLGAIFNDVPTNRAWYGKVYGYKYSYYEKYAGYYDA